MEEKKLDTNQEQQTEQEQVTKEKEAVTPVEEAEVVAENPPTEETKKDDATGELPEGADKSTESEKVERESEEGGDAGEETDTTDTDTTEDTPKEQDEETVTDIISDDEDITTETTEELDELKTKIAELEYEKNVAEETRKVEALIEKNKRDFVEFKEFVNDRIVQELNRFGVPLDMDINQMKRELPDKFEILQTVLKRADQETNRVVNEIATKEREAINNVIFTKAGNIMKKFNLSEDEIKSASDTFIRILYKVGIENLDEDLKDKVELAIARAKMISGDTIKTVEDVKELVEDVKEAKKDVEAIVASKEETTTDDTVKDLDAYKESATPSQSVSVPAIGRDNVIELLNSKTGRDRMAFFAKHKDLINQVMHERGGIRYTK